MKLLMLTAVSALALMTAGCGRAGSASAVATGRLDCPSTQGELTRVSEAADGKTCLYRISDGAEVSLQLVPVLAQGPDATLAQVEAQLKAQTGSAGVASSDMPPASREAAEQANATKAEASADAAVAAAAESVRDADRDARTADRDARHADRDARHADRDAKRAEREAQSELDRSIEARVNAKLREKGIDVDDDENGGGKDEAHVNLPGIHINAGSDRADVHVGPIHVNANGDTATVRSVQDVRMRGEGLSMRKRGIRAMFVYAGDDLGGGYKYVGYEASGPRNGPLAVAVVKSKADNGFHGDIYGDVKRLVRRNGGT